MSHMDNYPQKGPVHAPGETIYSYGAKLVPVLDKDGSVLLYDIYIDDVWQGSRRTIRQCEEQMRQVRHAR